MNVCNYNVMKDIDITPTIKRAHILWDAASWVYSSLGQAEVWVWRIVWRESILRLLGYRWIAHTYSCLESQDVSICDSNLPLSLKALTFFPGIKTSIILLLKVSLAVILISSTTWHPKSWMKRLIADLERQIFIL